MSRRGSDDEPIVETRTAAAEYVAITASRLSRMAAAHDFPLLAHMLEQAVLEAWEEASRNNRKLRGRAGAAGNESGD